MCHKGTSGTYDGRAQDLWAVGVTLYVWRCGRMPFTAPTVMLLMEKIRDSPAHVNPPAEASAPLASVIKGLLTSEPSKRLTLNECGSTP